MLKKALADFLYYKVGLRLKVEFDANNVPHTYFKIKPFRSFQSFTVVKISNYKYPKYIF